MRNRDVIFPGDRFGRLLVLARIKGDRWAVVCDCGTFADGRTDRLRTGRHQSCGCLQREVAARVFRATKTRHGHYSHGKETPDYHLWRRMISRCHDPKDANYFKYGARGITVSEQWRSSYDQFIADMGHRPNASMSIDRIDNNKGYEKENCRWATKLTQSRNRRHVKPVTIRGVSRLLPEWAEISGVPLKQIHNRLRNPARWSYESAVFTPARSN